MRLNSAGLLVASLLTNINAIPAPPSLDEPIVVTKNGRIHGVFDAATPDVRQFLSVPYAQPPVGNLRFAPPKPAGAFQNGHRIAKSEGPSCMQHIFEGPSINNNDVLELNLGGLNGTTGPISEDCLTLSIWAPRIKDEQKDKREDKDCNKDEKQDDKVKEKKKGLPVLVFFYGGAFYTGGTNVPYQNPAKWVQRTGKHIVVSFNHRGNIFGYPNARGLSMDKQNLGLLDMRVAVEWVRDNIAAFGGDPAHIGLFGASSGAVAIAYYSYTYQKDPIVNSLIMQSSNENVDVLTRDPKQTNFTSVAKKLNCEFTDGAKELSCMRGVSAEAINEVLRESSAAIPPVTFSPIIDNITVYGDYAALAKAGKLAKLPVLIGSNRNDGVNFVPYNPSGVNTAEAEQMTSFYFFCPTLASAKMRLDPAANYTAPVRRYLYSGNFPNISPRTWMGAWHGSELPLIFGTHGDYRGESTRLEGQTSRAMQDAWVKFVETDGKETGIKDWSSGSVVEFGKDKAAKVVNLKEMEDKCS